MHPAQACGSLKDPDRNFCAAARRQRSAQRQGKAVGLRRADPRRGVDPQRHAHRFPLVLEHCRRAEKLEQSPTLGASVLPTSHPSAFPIARSARPLNTDESMRTLLLG